MYITPTGMVLLGPDQIRQYFQASFKRAPEARIKVQTGQVKTIRPDLVVGVGTMELDNLIDPAGKPLHFKGAWVSTFAMQGERWIPIAHASAITLDAYAPAHA